jgi:hypothetical protein
MVVIIAKQLIGAHYLTGDDLRLSQQLA